MTQESFVFCDLNLSKRLETAEAIANRHFVEARAASYPESGACWKEVAGATLMFDGKDSPLTQSFGLGLYQEVTDSDMDYIENFYNSFNAPSLHEISPMAYPGLLPLLKKRRYFPVELSSVMFRQLSGGISVEGKVNENITVRQISQDEQIRWAELSAEGWNEFPEYRDSIFELMKIGSGRTGASSFFAEFNGKPIATAGMTMHQGVALMAGASTIPEARKQGAQLALLKYRLDYAVSHGCDIAMMCALPGSTSQKNAERQGFRIIYTRIKWGKEE